MPVAPIGNASNNLMKKPIAENAEVAELRREKIKD
jgi:hypothetical protein